MASLKYVMTSAVGLLAALASPDGTEIFLMAGILGLLVMLVMILAMLGVFGGADRRKDAKEVLRILLGRERVSKTGYDSVDSQSVHHE
jgi:hypothetical protein